MVYIFKETRGGAKRSVLYIIFKVIGRDTNGAFRGGPPHRPQLQQLSMRIEREMGRLRNSGPIMVEPLPKTVQKKIGKIPENFRKNPQNFRNISGTFPEQFRKCLGTFPETFRNNSGFFPNKVHFEGFPGRSKKGDAQKHTQSVSNQPGRAPDDRKSYLMFTAGLP